MMAKIKMYFSLVSFMFMLTLVRAKQNGKYFADKSC